MSDALAAVVRADPALAAVLAFSRRFGRDTTALAMHAALPLGLSPELVHLLRMNFVREAPFIAEADLLLSPLCTEVGGGMYEMDADVRELLLAEMGRTAAFGPAHVRRVARFLRAWAARGLDETVDPDAQDHLRVQLWVALAYDEPTRAAEALAGALRAGVDAADRPEVARVARLTTVLSAPLAAQVELRRYAGAVERLAATGSAATGAAPVTIGRERLPSLDRVVRLWNPHAASSTPDSQQQQQQQQSNVAEAPPIQQQGEEPDSESIPMDGQYRVARVLIIGPVHASELMGRIGAPHVASTQRDGLSAWAWETGIGDQIHGGHEVIFHQPSPDDGAFALAIEESVAIVVLVSDDQDARSIEPWLATAASGGPSRPALVVVRTTGDRAPDLSSIESLAKRYGTQGPVVFSARTRGEIPEVSDRIHQMIPWSRVPAAHSGAEVHWLQGEMDERFSVGLAVEYNEELRRELSQLLPLSYHDREAELARAMQCLTAQGFLRVIGNPPRAVVRGEAYERCRSEIWRAAAAAKHDVVDLPSVPVRWLREHIPAREPRRPMDTSLLDLVLEDLTLRGWAYLADTGRGQILVIPRIIDLPSSTTSPPDASFDAVIRATWRGTPDDVFVLLLVHLADLGQVDLRMPDLAYVVTPHGMLRLNASATKGQVQLELAATPGSDGLEAASRLFREAVTRYVPADVTPELLGLQFGPPAGEENQLQSQASPQSVETTASPPYEFLQPPEGVDLSEACLVVVPSGTKQVAPRAGEPARKVDAPQIINLDDVWEHLMKPAIAATLLPEDRSLVPVRITELPAPGSPLPDWMKAARLVVVDLTGTDPVRIQELGLMPGVRTQTVVLFQEIYDPPLAFTAAQQVHGYAYGTPGELAGQRALLSTLLTDALGVPRGGTGGVTETLVITAGGVIVRQGPGTQHPVIGQLSEGTHVELLERAEGWIRIRTTDDMAGWVPANFAVEAPPEGAEQVSLEFVVNCGDRIAGETQLATIAIVATSERSRPTDKEYLEHFGAPPSDVLGTFPMAAGTGVEVRLEAPWRREPDRISTEWQGQWHDRVLPVSIPPEVPAGEVRLVFTISIRHGESSEVRVHRVVHPFRIEEPGTNARTPDGTPKPSAYVCYASSDREQVLKDSSYIGSTREMDVYIDQVLEAGDGWERRINREIGSRDVFMLFWSPAAAKSVWVEREWRRALHSNRATGKPEIRIHLLQGVQFDTLPEELKRFYRPDPPEHAIFLSYASEDHLQAVQLADQTRRTGLPVWFDQHAGLQAGGEYQAEIAIRIQTASIFVPLLSRNVQHREGYFVVEWNLAEAEERGRLSDLPFIVPICLDDLPGDTPEVPEFLRNIHWVRVDDGDDFTAAVHRLRDIYRDYRRRLADVS